MTFDELGNCSSNVGPCSSVFAPDPTGKVTGNLLIFTLPQPTFTADVNIYEPDGITLSDHLRWISPANYNPPNSNLACLATGTVMCADRMIFYSLDDLNGHQPIFTTTVHRSENPDGSFQYVSIVGNVYKGVSDVPLPAALPLFDSGLGVLGLPGWRRKKRANAA